jgi:hypothetical protein
LPVVGLPSKSTSSTPGSGTLSYFLTFNAATALLIGEPLQARVNFNRDGVAEPEPARFFGVHGLQWAIEGTPVENRVRTRRIGRVERVVLCIRRPVVRPAPVAVLGGVVVMLLAALLTPDTSCVPFVSFGLNVAAAATSAVQGSYVPEGAFTLSGDVSGIRVTTGRATDSELRTGPRPRRGMAPLDNESGSFIPRSARRIAPKWCDKFLTPPPR